MNISKKRFDIIICLVIFAAALFLFTIEEGRVKTGFAMERNVPTIARSYIYVRFITLGVLLLSGIIIIAKTAALRKNKSASTVTLLGKEVSITIISLFSYLLLMKFIGFYAVSFILITVLLSMYRFKEDGIKPGRDKKTWKIIGFSCAFAVILLIVLHFLFVILLKVIVPAGII